MQLEFRQRLLASTLLIGAAAFGTPAFAQDATEDTAEQTADVGDPAARLCAENPNAPECAAEGTAIVVTGSRIASPTLTSASPLQIVDSADIDQSGVVNVQEVLLDNPAFGVPALSRTNSNFLTSSAGVATVDLRNLGSNRTLVLVNGRRFVAGVPTSSIVDLNTIPTQFIERIDILTGGASSIYGSDAVAGVVNIIYKDDFEGIEANGQIGVSERGDDVRKQANLIIGSNFADGRGNVTVHLGYSDEGAVFTRNRSRSNIDQISCYFFTGELDDVFRGCRPFLSSFNPNGTITAGGQNFTRNPITGAFGPPNTNAGGPVTGCGERICGGLTGNETGFNRSAYRTIAVPTERYLMALRANYDLTDNITWFAEGTFAKTTTVSELEPFPLSSAGAIGGTFPATGGFFPIERDVTIAAGAPLPAPGDATCDPVTRVCRIRNPLVPDIIFNAATDVNGDGLRDVSFTRRLSDFGNRGNEADRITYRFLTGVEGNIDFGLGEWRWDAFYAFGETTEAQTSGGQVNQPNFRQALDVIPDVNDVDGDLNFEEPICRDEQARAEGCLPADIFAGAGGISEGALNYLEAPSFLKTKTQQKLAGANLSGQLFDPWGAGPIGLAIGTEYRKEFSSSRSDSLTITGQNGGNALPDTEGEFDVIEAYAELAVPIITERPFFDLLEFRAAGRVSDYSSVGTVYSYNLGLEWAPVSDVRFRGVYARATRAPNIGELFTPPSQTFPPGLQDPCEGVGPTGDSPEGGQGDLCRADPGIAANIATNGVFTLNQADLQGVSGFNSGNPNLGEEKSDTYTLGVVINPRSISWLRNFAFTVDYFNITIDDAIVATPRQFILDQCYVAGNAELCEFITRRPEPEGPNSAGTLEFINSSVTNSGGFKTEGIDVTASYRQNLEDWGLDGNLNLRVAWTHVLKGYIIPLVAEPDRDEFNREVGGSRNKVFAQAAYTLNEFTGILRGNYIGPAYLDEQFTGIEFGDEGSEDFKVGAEFILDAQLRWAPGDNYEFYFGVDNVLDNEPPLIPTGLSNTDTGVETNAGTYDAIGRRYYAGATLKF
jgi:outer membrane receptor protein involved in Fe transport